MRTLRRRLRVVEALALLLVGRALRRWVPMKRWSRVLGPTLPPTATARPDLPDGAEAAVATAVASAARRGGGNCLEQAFAASVMLRLRRRRGVVVIGLDRTDPAAAPHAWLVGTSGRVVVGGEMMDQYVPVSQFGRST
ncbi:lasso peptide biosynthesis B2 protein [Nocardioides bizhenqiangii]|uniref:Lasso peptide biosynthesis B2 protein n=1 Tax=Nocardioides bizhenqiangii TaxID=3095076 RepID=A0ABZ0ZNT2_9ACTN|nr:lasso peptide biosynthesis B2 protein [Nocardioides sp. HM61]WQQ25974.1 lasso peptide biosynthesis B2 protein [Nocardioides sp. HM61]